MIYLLALVSLLASHASRAEELLNEVPTRSVEFKTSNKGTPSKLTFLEMKDRLRFDFEASGLQHGTYVIAVSEKCRTGAVKASTFSASETVLTEFKTKADAVSHESSTHDFVLAKDSPNTIMSHAVSIFRKESAGYKSLDCKMME